jgi:4'-phosphopantetheinyl transferase
MLDLWFVRTADVPPDHQAWAAVLEPHEVARAEARVFEQHRHEYRVTRVLCRAVLARYVGVSPAALRFRRNDYGRPELEPASAIRFNLTNTVELVAMAVSDEGEVGLDAEPASRADAILDVAPSVFTPFERDELSRMAIESRRVRAVQLWTLKEAYMKARGMGFSISPTSFEIDFASGDPVLRSLPPIDDRASSWQLEIHLAHGHELSICRAVVPDPAKVELHAADLVELLRLGES